MKKTPLKKVSDKQRKKQAEWAKITRRKITEGLKCELCNGENMDWRGISGGHHKNPRRNGDYSEDNHILLCCVCHSKLHGVREV